MTTMTLNVTHAPVETNGFFARMTDSSDLPR